MPRVSIIIPIYNRPTLLRRAVDSVLAQTFSDFELILVDDCSNDGITKNVIREFSTKDKRVKCLYLEKNSGGPAYPKNAGFSLVNGDYVAYLDSDDEWLPNKLEQQVTFLDMIHDQNLGLLSCNAFEVDDSRLEKTYPKISKNLSNAKKFGISVINAVSENYRSFKKISYSDAIDVLAYPDFFGSNNSGMILPKRVIEKIGPRDPDLPECEDTDILFRLAENGYNFYFVDEPLIVVHAHGGNFTKSYDQLGRKNAIIRARQLALLIEKHKTYTKKPSLFGNRLRGVGMLYLLGGEVFLARKYFLQAIKVSPFDIKNYLNILFSFFGSEFYRLIFVLRKKIFYAPY